MTNRTPQNTKASLIAAIEAGFRDIPGARLQNACSRFRSRLEQVLADEGARKTKDLDFINKVQKMVEEGLRVNYRIYLDVMKDVVVPWCISVANGRPWV